MPTHPQARKSTPRNQGQTVDHLDPVLDDLARCVQNETRLKTDRSRLVALARRKGASWRQIAQVLGVTPQAAHKRYAKVKT